MIGRLKTLIVMLLLLLILVASFISVLYTLDFQLYVSKNFRDIIGEDGIKFLDEVRANSSILTRMAKSNVLALTPKSFQLIQYLPATWRIALYRAIMSELSYPNLFLSICSSFNSSCTMIYNINELNNTKLMSMLRLLLHLSSSIKAYGYGVSFLPYFVPSSPNSDVCLIFDDLNKNSTLLSSLALSAAGINHTQVHFLDVGHLSLCKWIIVPSTRLYKHISQLLRFTDINNNVQVILLNFEGRYDVLQSNLSNAAKVYIKSTYADINFNIGHIGNDYYINKSCMSGTIVKTFIYPYGRVTPCSGDRVQNIELSISPKIAKSNEIVNVVYFGINNSTPLYIQVHNLHFINIYPLFKAFNNGLVDLQRFLNTLKKVFIDAGIPKGKISIDRDTDFVSLYKVVLKDIEARGRINVEPLSGSIIVVSCTSTLCSSNTTIIVDGDDMIIHGSRLRIIERKGYYVVLKLRNATIDSKDGLRLLLLRSNGNTGMNTTTRMNASRFTLGDALLIVRGVNVEALGDVNIKKIYTFKDLYARFKFRGHNAHVYGTLKISLSVFDNYVAGEKLEIHGSVERFTKSARSYELDLDFVRSVFIPVILMTATLVVLHKVAFKRWVF